MTVNNTNTLYAGTGLTLTCIVTLDSSVDNNEHVRIDWSRMPEERFTVTPVMRVSDSSSYTASLTISPLADHDDGTYTCIVTVTGGTTATASDSVTITVMGECILCVSCTCVHTLPSQLCQLQWWLYLQPVESPLLASPTPSPALWRQYQVSWWSPVLCGPEGMAL